MNGVRKAVRLGRLLSDRPTGQSVVSCTPVVTPIDSFRAGGNLAGDNRQQLSIHPVLERKKTEMVFKV